MEKAQTVAKHINTDNLSLDVINEEIEDARK